MKTAIVVLALLLAGCGGSKPTAPPDPNREMYGTWQGTMRLIGPGGTQEGQITVVLSRGNAAFYDAGGQYPTTLTSMADPNVAFFITAYGYRIDFAGTRQGTSLQGTCGNAGIQVVGEWALTKTSAAIVRGDR